MCYEEHLLVSFACKKECNHCLCLIVSYSYHAVFPKSPELKSLLDYIDGNKPEDDFTRELEDAVGLVRKNEKWRLDYMTLQMNYQEKYEQGLAEGIEQGIEQGNRQSAIKMIKAGKLSSEEIAMYSGLTLEQVIELEKELQCV